MQRDSKGQQKIPVKYEIIMAVFIPVVVLPLVGFVFFITPTLGVDLRKMSFFSAYRTLLAVVLPTVVFPASVFGEFMNKNWKKRKFLWKSALAGMGIGSIFIATTLILLTVFDSLFSELNIIWQIPLAVICSSIGLVIMALVVKSKRFKKMAREKLGW